jgi:hypothetical protein
MDNRDIMWKAVQDLIIKARSSAFEGAPSIWLFEFLDQMEYLPGLLLNKNDCGSEFEEYLEMTCIKFECIEVLNRYKLRVEGSSI